ncbi:MAG: transcriptional regulator, HxlR family [Acidobacteriaceae bacterium]|nr:transcriptional regulator, HxlR family [Acidobacteriaceae bacterium]
MQKRKDQRTGTQTTDLGYSRRVSLTLEVLFRGKWRVHILCALRVGPVRLGQLARFIPGASKKMLTHNLRRLEADGIVVRRDLSETVLHVEYDLDDQIRESLFTLLENLANWGDSYLARSIQAESEEGP